MRTTLFLALFALSIGPGASAGDLDPGNAPGSPAALSVFNDPSRGIAGILDPSKLDMSNSLSILYASGARGSRGIGVGMYENRLTYRLADPLRVTLLLGYQVSSFGGGDGTSNAEEFLPGVAVTYQPSPRFLLQFQYRRLSPFASPYASSAYPRSYGLFPEE